MNHANPSLKFVPSRVSVLVPCLLLTRQTRKGESPLVGWLFDGCLEEEKKK